MVVVPGNGYDKPSPFTGRHNQSGLIPIFFGTENDVKMMENELGMVCRPSGTHDLHNTYRGLPSPATDWTVASRLILSENPVMVLRASALNTRPQPGNP